MDLFDQHLAKITEESAPLAARMRPQTLDQFIGQEHIIGQGRLLRRAISLDELSSLIFSGLPGTGKTNSEGFSLCGLFALLTYEVENASMNFPLVRSDGVLSDFNSFAGHRFSNRCSISKDNFWYQYIHASFE
jgi:hypothetical protein